MKVKGILIIPVEENAIWTDDAIASLVGQTGPSKDDLFETRTFKITDAKRAENGSIECQVDFE